MSTTYYITGFFIFSSTIIFSKQIFMTLDMSMSSLHKVFSAAGQMEVSIQLVRRVLYNDLDIAAGRCSFIFYFSNATCKDLLPLLFLPLSLLTTGRKKKIIDRPGIIVIR